MNDLPDYVLTNQTLWDSTAGEWVEIGERAWSGQPSWGIWSIPESKLSLLPPDMTGMRSVELGCGTAYVSAWMVRRGAAAVGIDASERQLETARRLAAQHGLAIELIHGNAETVPFPDESFDFAISEYGVAIWADPYKWVPEAWRILRPGGTLVMLGNHPLVHMTQPRDADEPATRTLLYPYFGMHRIDWDDGEEQGTEFNLSISGWHKLWADTGFEFLEYLELRAPAAGAEVRFYATADWAYDYPTEQVWKVRKPA